MKKSEYDLSDIENEQFINLFYTEYNNQGFEKLAKYNIIKLDNKLKEMINTTNIKESFKTLSPLTRIMSLIFAIEGTKSIDCTIEQQMNAIAYLALFEFASNFELGIYSKDELEMILRDILPNTNQVMQNYYNLVLKK